MNQNHYIIIPLVLACHSVPSSVETQAAGGDRDTDDTETVTKVSITRRPLPRSVSHRDDIYWKVVMVKAGSSGPFCASQHDFN